MAEELICGLATTSLEIDKHGSALNIKNGVTTTRDAIQKKATYGLINKTVQDVLAHGKDEAATKAFEKEYKENVRPYIGHGLDFIFRGIKYWNDPTKAQTLLAYSIDDFGPYIAKKIIVNHVHKFVRLLLEQNAYGQWIAGAYDIACEVPLLGTELEGLSRAMLEAMYDKGCQMMDKKLLIKKYLLPKIALYCTPQHYVHLR